jgi:predicted nucleic acid-binding protein
MKLAYVDSCVWITRIEGLPAYRKIINASLKNVGFEGYVLSLSDAVLLEILQKPYKDNNISLIDIYNKLFEKVKILKSFQNVFKDALKIARSENLNAMDAIHVAIAVRHKCKYFVSTDPHLKNLGIIQSFWIDLKETDS